MAKQNYAFEKRQKEIAKKQKKQEKLNQKAESKDHPNEDQPILPVDPAETVANAE